MAFNYTAMAQTAARLLDNFGQPLTYTRTNQGGFDPATGDTATTETTYTAISVWTGYGVSEIDGTVIKQGDAKVFTSPLDTRPLIGDTVVKDGRTWRIMDAMPIQPASTDVVYIVQVRLS